MTFKKREFKRSLLFVARSATHGSDLILNELKHLFMK